MAGSEGRENAALFVPVRWQGMAQVPIGGEAERLFALKCIADNVRSQEREVNHLLDATLIQFDTKTIDFFWLLGFGAWRAIEVYAPALKLVTSCGIPLNQALSVDAERGQFELDFRQRIARAQSLITADRTAHISWPEDVPEPTADRESLDDVQHRATFDLVALALAFSLLHELKHVIFCADGSAPSTLPEEEIACDTYARDFMTSRLAAYAEKHGHDFAEVQQKRAMGIALAAVIIHAMTPTHAHWGDRQYPPMAERLTAMLHGYTLPACSSFWPFTACLLIAVMRQESCPLDIVANSEKEMVEMLLERIR